MFILFPFDGFADWEFSYVIPEIVNSSSFGYGGL